jgi:HEAT repeat protein
MRSKDACPLLLELQADETFGSALFIITRAIVRSARDINDINRMVQMIIEHRKSCSELVADILQEVEFDYSPLLIDWLQSEEDELVQIALLCLNGQTTLKLDEHLVKLIKSEKKEIRVKAAKVWLGQSASPAPAVIIDFLAHPDWEIRAQAAKAAGSIGSPIFLDLLKETVQDEFWWVRYYSAKSLERLEGNALQPVYEVVI